MGNKQADTQPQQSASDKMFDSIFEFKMMAKNFKKESAKAEQAEKAAILKVKDAIEKNLGEAAKIHAADAMRRRNETRRYLILSSKIEAVHDRLQNAYQTQKLTDSMKELTQRMGSAVGNMDLVKINEIMGGFEKTFDNLDVNAEFMDRAMDNVNAGSYEEKDVNGLIAQIAEENNLKLESEFSDISVKSKDIRKEPEQKELSKAQEMQ